MSGVVSIERNEAAAGLTPTYVNCLDRPVTYPPVYNYTTINLLLPPWQLISKQQTQTYNAAFAIYSFSTIAVSTRYRIQGVNRTYQALRKLIPTMASAMDLSEWENDPKLYLFTSLTAGSSHIITATSRLETILKANRLPFQAIDTATDEKARRLWGRRAGKRKLPGLVKEGYVLGVRAYNNRAITATTADGWPVVPG